MVGAHCAHFLLHSTKPLILGLTMSHLGTPFPYFTACLFPTPSNKRENIWVYSSFGINPSPAKGCLSTPYRKIAAPFCSIFSCVQTAIFSSLGLWTQEPSLKKPRAFGILLQIENSEDVVIVGGRNPFGGKIFI